VADTFPARIRQAIADPGSIIPRIEVGDDGLPVPGYEPRLDWEARAVLMVASEARWVPSSENDGVANPVFVAVALGFYGLLMLVVGLWLGSVWL
jgi:hypothetical protein